MSRAVRKRKLVYRFGIVTDRCTKRTPVLVRNWYEPGVKLLSFFLSKRGGGAVIADIGSGREGGMKGVSWSKPNRSGDTFHCSRAPDPSNR